MHQKSNHKHDDSSNESEIEQEEEPPEDAQRRNPTRERNRPQYLRDDIQNLINVGN